MFAASVLLKSALFLSVLLLAVNQCRGWDQAELDLFDLVEEVGENFYDVLHVEQTATPSEIKRSFRQLSLQLHPDKSDDPDATEKFRKVVAVAEVLKDPQLRERYNLILVEGLPDWRMPIYYYRRVRKMGLLELTILLMVIGCVGQYLFGVAVYVEKKLMVHEVLTRKQKKFVKKSKTAKASASTQRLEAELSALNEQATASIPALHNLLPFWLAKTAFALAKFSWSLYHQWRHATPTSAKAGTSEKEGSAKETAANDSDQPMEGVNGSIDGRELGAESSKEKTATNGDGDNEGSKVKRRRGKWVPEELRASSKRVQDDKPYVPPSYYGADELEDKDESDDSTSSTDIDESANQLLANTDAVHVVDDSCISETKLNEEENSSAIKDEKSSGELKTGSNTTAGERIGNGEARENRTSNRESDISSVTTNDGGSVGVVTADKSSGPSSWSQYQQKQLEWALVQYSKFDKDRWENIAKAVPGKSKEECIERFKDLCSVIRSKKEATSSESQS